MFFELDGRFYDVCRGFKKNSRYCGLFFFLSGEVERECVFLGAFERDI